MFTYALLLIPTICRCHMKAEEFDWPITWVHLMPLVINSIRGDTHTHTHIHTQTHTESHTFIQTHTHTHTYTHTHTHSTHNTHTTHTHTHKVLMHIYFADKNNYSVRKQAHAIQRPGHIWAGMYLVLNNFYNIYSLCSISFWYCQSHSKYY